MPFGHVLDAPALRASGFAPCSPYGGPVFRPCGLRFAPCPRASSPSGLRVRTVLALRRPGVPALRTPFGRVLAPPALRASGFAPILNSAWSSHCAHKLACGTPCFIGLTSACFAHSARPSCAPALTLARCSASADALWACPRRSSPSGLRVRTVLACFARAPAFAPCCANACTVFRSCALRVLAPSPLRGLAYWRAGTARHISAYALVAPSAAQCSVSAHYASLRVLDTPAASRPSAPNCLGLVGLRPPS